MLGEVGLELIKHVKLERTEREILKSLIKRKQNEENENPDSTKHSLKEFIELYEDIKKDSEGEILLKMDKEHNITNIKSNKYVRNENDIIIDDIIFISDVFITFDICYIMFFVHF